MVKPPTDTAHDIPAKKAGRTAVRQKKIGRGIATRPILDQDLRPCFQSDMLNYEYFTRKLLNVKGN
jgi:hypothetical protein